MRLTTYNCFADLEAIVWDPTQVVYDSWFSLAPLAYNSFPIRRASQWMLISLREFDLIVRMRSLIALNHGSESVVCKITRFRTELHDTAIIGVVPKPLDSTDPHLSEG